MDKTRCENCKYFRTYYMGCVDGQYRFSHVCMWAYRYIEDIGAMECHRTGKNSSQRV